jgi:hypothetical protein
LHKIRAGQRFPSPIKHLRALSPADPQVCPQMQWTDAGLKSGTTMNTKQIFQLCSLTYPHFLASGAQATKKPAQCCSASSGFPEIHLSH